MAPDTRGVYDVHPILQHANTADALFVHEAALGGMAEVNAGKLAARKAQSSAVKDFANLMVSDHSKANQRLAGFASSSAKVPLDTDHKVMLDRLEKSSGKTFDEAYIRGQVMEHQKTAQLFEWIIGSGEDPRVTGFAIETLPSVLRHLEMAKSIQAQLTGSAP
jgi:putative membrane protein